MRILIALIIMLFTKAAIGQESDISYLINNQFRYHDGSVLLKDSVRKNGEIVWRFGNRYNEINFRDKTNDETVTYAPDQILGFNIGPLNYVPLFDLKVHGAKYVSNRIMSNVKKAFCQIIHQGNINIYLVYVTGYDALSGLLKLYPNFVFTKRLENKEFVVTYPYGILMKDRKYEKAKEQLYPFFKGYPEVTAKIRDWHYGEDFTEIIDLISKL